MIIRRFLTVGVLLAYFYSFSNLSACDYDCVILGSPSIGTNVIELSNGKFVGERKVKVDVEVDSRAVGCYTGATGPLIQTLSTVDVFGSDSSGGEYATREIAECMAEAINLSISQDYSGDSKCCQSVSYSEGFTGSGDADECDPCAPCNSDSSNAGEVFNGFGSCLSCSSATGASLGGVYYFKLTDRNAGMGYGWKNDFDIYAGKYLDTSGKEVYTVHHKSSFFFFRKQADGTFTSDYKNQRAQVINVSGTNIFRVKVGKVAYEFNEPAVAGATGFQKANKMTQIVYEVDNSGVVEYKGFDVDFTYDTSGRLEKIENESGELYTFHYNVDGLLEAVKNHASENLRTFTYDTNRNLTSRWQKGLGTTTFTYVTVDGHTHILKRIQKPGGVDIEYTINGTGTGTDSYERTYVVVDYEKMENAYQGPQTIETFHYIPSPGVSYTEYKRPLRDNEGTLIYATSRKYEDVIYDDPEFGTVTKKETLEENGATTITYRNGIYNNVVFSQTTGTDGTVKTTKNEYDDNGNLLKTVTRYAATIPAGTWDMTYEYDMYNRVVKTTERNGVETHTEYRAITGAGMIDQVVAKWQEKDDVVINKTTYEYYAETAPVHQRYRLWKKIEHLDENTTYTTTNDYIASDNDNPQNIGKLWKKTYADGSFEEYSYGCCDVATQRNRLGGVTTYVRDAAGRVTSKTEPSGAVTTYTYDLAGRVLTTTIPAGGTFTNTYDAQGRLTRTDYPDNSFTETTYRVDGQVATMTSRTSLVTTHTFSDTDGALLKTSVLDGDLRQVTYDGLGRTLTSTNARDLTLTMLYDDEGRNYKTIWPDATFTEQSYNAGGQMGSSKNRMGYEITFEYDDFGRQTAAVAPNGLRNETIFDNLSRATSSKVKDNITTLTTSYVLNFEGKPTAVSYPDGISESSVYTNGQLTSRTDKAGKIWTYTYTVAGQSDQVIAPDGLGIVSDTDYNTKGQVSQQTGSNGVTISFTYDNMGRQTKTTYPDATFTQTEYGVSGPTAQIDRGALRTEITYDIYGRRTSVKDPRNQTISYGLNLAGDMTSMTDSNNNVTSWEFDAEGRNITKTYADNSKYIYTYNANGLLLTRKDAKNITTTYSYNNMNQLTGIDYPNDTDISYTYDKFGNKLTMTDASGTTTFSYDALKRSTGENGPLTANDTITYSYDAAGRKGTMTTPGKSVTLGYDSAGRLSTVTAGSDSYVYSYIGTSSQVDTMSRNGNVAVDNDFDNLARLTLKTNKNSNGAVINSYAYELNDNDQRTKMTLADGKYIEYQYDLAGQVIGAKRYFANGNQDFSYNYGFNYDPMGNPLNRTSQGQSRDYTFNHLNQFASATAPNATDVTGQVQPNIVDPKVQVNGLPDPAATPESDGRFTVFGVPLTTGNNTLITTVTDKFNRTLTRERDVSLKAAPVFTYDANGNTLSNGSVNYTWNEENRMIAVEPVNPVLDDKKCEFVYDANGRRRIKKVFTWDGSAWQQTRERHFVYNGFKQVAELDAADDIEKTTLWNGEEVLEVVDNGESFYPTIDGNKNITAYINTTNNVLAKYTYSPFGKIVEKSGAMVDDMVFRFSSEVFDNETGLVYYNYRYYSPELGRWTKRDPIGETGGQNLYNLVLNNPVGGWDFAGLYECSSDAAFFRDPILAMDGYGSSTGSTNTCTGAYAHWGRAENWAKWSSITAICNSGKGEGNSHVTIKLKSTEDCCCKYRVTCIYDYSGVITQNAPASKPNRPVGINFGGKILGDEFKYNSPGKLQFGVWRATMFKFKSKTKIIELEAGAEMTLFDSWPAMTAGVRENDDNGKWVGASFDEVLGAHCEIEEMGACDSASGGSH